MASPLPRPSTSDVQDRTREDFQAGELGAGLHLATTASGSEIILAPTVAGEFGDGVPSDWFVEPWKEGGRALPNGSALLVDGATVGYPTLFGSSRSLEFVATFSKRPHQHVGFGTDFRSVPWVTFSTKFGNSLYARTNFIIPEDTRLPASLLGRRHQFRIHWRVIDVAFSVDGREVAHQLAPVVGYMRPLVGNGSLGGGPLAIEWMRMSPYAREGTFTSRVHRAGRPALWEACEADAEIPPVTSVAVEVRTGDTAQPDESWSPWGQPPLPGGFVQYRARLATTDPDRTPVVRAVTLSYSSSGPS